MRILHFSDFHLRSGDAGKRSLEILDRMIEAINNIKKEKSIDLVVFSGDLVDKAGYDFELEFSEVLNRFKKDVIDKVIVASEIPNYRFLFVGGNHEVMRGLINEDEHDKQLAIKNEKELEQYMFKDDIQSKTASMKIFLDFQKKFYEDAQCADVEILNDDYQTELKFTIDGTKIGVVLLNSSWMCGGNNDEKHIAMGVAQLNQSYHKIKDCTLKLALAHHHPTFLKDFDGSCINTVLHKHFDVYFCGHTHSQKSKYVEDVDGSVFESIAAGNLYDNMHEVDASYKNGFTIIDYNLENKSVEVTPYEQQVDESFGLNYNYGKTHNGTWYFYKYEPGVLLELDKWLASVNPEFSIIADKCLSLKRKDLVDPAKTRIILTGLSGLGKTRLIYDAFNDGSNHKNCYYAKLSSTNIESVIREIRIRTQETGSSNGMFIIDNCTIDIHNTLLELVPANIKLICVDNEYYDIKGVQGEYLVKIEPQELREEIATFVERNLPLNKDNRNVYERILLIADGYPFMAHKLVNEYHEHREITTNTADDLVHKIVNYDPECKTEQDATMQMLSLFQPFPLRKANRSAFEFILNNDILSGLSGNYIARQKTLNSVVVRFNESLIEKTDQWINVRPFSLAIWLVGKWFSNIDEELVEQLLEQFEELRQRDESAYKLLAECLSKRIDYMRDNPLAYDLITRLNDGPIAPFANEKVVCSDLGSRLFLSMSAVNPIAVAKCLDLVFVNKDDEWLRRNITNNIRRNLVWTLEKLCFSAESYPISSLLMARFAMAENEEWSNNATGQFLQLFHIVLAGTEADLMARLKTLFDLNNNAYYTSLLIKAINSAFMSSGFVRTGGAEKFGNYILEDFQPTNREIWDYWIGCKNLLQRIVEDSPSYLDAVAEVIVTHSAHWLRDGYFDMIFKPLVDVIFEKKQKDWPELYSSVRKFVRPIDLKRYVKDKATEIISYIDGLKPSSFITKLRDAQIEYWNRGSRDLSDSFEVLENLYYPLAKQFVEEGVYTNADEVRKMVYDQDFIDIVFTREVVKLFSDGQLGELFEVLNNIIAEKGDDFHSPYVIKLCLESIGRVPLYSFLDSLLENKWYKLYISLSSRCEDDQMTQFKKLLSLNRDKTLPFDFLEIYLSCVGCENQSNLYNLLKAVFDEYPNRVKDIVACLLRFRFIIQLNALPEFAVFIKQILLLFPIDNNHPQTNYEYSRFVKDILEGGNDREFAVQMNHKLIEDFNRGYLHGNFDGIYTILLQKYKDEIWKEFSSAFISDDYSLFWLQIHNEIGSGFGFGAGAMFDNNDNLIKRMCMEYPDKAPAKIAGIVPVFGKDPKDSETFSDIFLWLLENYGENEYVRSGLHANMHSFSWTGSTISLFKSYKQCLLNIPSSRKTVVDSWISDCIKECDAEIEREQTNNDYMRMHYGHSFE